MCILLVTSQNMLRKRDNLLISIKFIYFLHDYISSACINSKINIRFVYLLVIPFSFTNFLNYPNLYQYR